MTISKIEIDGVEFEWIGKWASSYSGSRIYHLVGSGPAYTMDGETIGRELEEKSVCGEDVSACRPAPHYFRPQPRQTCPECAAKLMAAMMTGEEVAKP